MTTVVNVFRAIVAAPVLLVLACLAGIGLVWLASHMRPPRNDDEPTHGKRQW